MVCKILSIVNQKGGVGKTTTSVNIATALAASNKKTLIIDLDPQANATTAFQAHTKSKQYKNVYNFLLNDNGSSDDIILTFVPNLWMLASNINLIGAEVEIARMPNKEFVLRSKIQKIQEFFDYIIIDCPPSMGFLSLNAINTSNYIMIPLQCEYYALEGLNYLLQSMQTIKSNFNKDVSVLGILLTMFDKRSSLCVQVANDVRYHFKKLVFHTPIPRNVKMAEAPSHGKPGIIYDVKANASIAYLEVTKEIIERTTEA